MKYAVFQKNLKTPVKRPEGKEREIKESPSQLKAGKPKTRQIERREHRDVAASRTSFKTYAKSRTMFQEKSLKKRNF